MTVTHTRENGISRLRLSGELDHHCAADCIRQLGDVVDTYLPMHVQLDMGGVPFTDSSGIAVILSLSRKLRSYDAELRVTNLRSQPLRVLTLSGVDKVVTLETAID